MGLGDTGERSRARVRTETPAGDTSPAIVPPPGSNPEDEFADLLIDDIDAPTAVNSDPGPQHIVSSLEDTQSHSDADGWDPPTIVMANGQARDATEDITESKQTKGLINPNASLERSRNAVSPPRLKLKSLGRYGRYEILGQLAVGGMAEIYLARETSSDGNVTRLLVIKRIREQSGTDDEFVSMFINEARLAMYLRHPNICYLYEYGRVGDDHFLAIEYIDGQTFRKLLGRAASTRRPVPQNITIKIVSHIAGALHHAHRATDHHNNPLKIVHRDVSPHNIMLGYDGVVKLLDFGVAKAATQTTLTRAGIVRGKFAYMSPQQCLGDRLDGRSDLFSLGTVLFEGLTGRRLFRRENQFDTMRTIVEEPIPSIRSIDPTIPIELERIVDRALQKDPDKRFQTGAEFQQALEEYLASSGEVVGEDTISAFMHSMFASEVKQGPDLSDDFELAAELTGSDNESPKGVRGWVWVVLALALAGGALYYGRDFLLFGSSGNLHAGTLAIYAAPGAEVFVDNQSYGEGEITVENLKPGKHSLRVVKDGYRPWVGEVEITANDIASIQPPLVREAPKATIRVLAPDGAWVVINGHRISEGGEVSRELKPGRYRITVGKDGFRTWREEKVLELQGNLELKPKLEPATDADYGQLSINANVAGTEIWSNGKQIGVVPLRSERMLAGEVYLQLKTPDGEVHDRKIKVPGNNKRATHFFKL